MHLVNIRTILYVTLFLFNSHVAYAQKNSNAHPISNIRASTAAKATAIIENKQFSKPGKGGYHAGPDTRYQPSKKDASVTKLSGGKNINGKYKHTEKR